MLQLFVKNATLSSTEVLCINFNERVYDIKLKLQEETSVSVAHQCLIKPSLGTILKDDCTLSDYNIQNKDVLSLKLINYHFIKVVIGECTETIECDPKSHIIGLKEWIHDKKQIPTQHQTLQIQNTVLSNTQSLCDISNMPITLHLHLPYFVISVQTLSGKMLEFVVKGIHTIRSLKSQIHASQRLKPDRQCLYLNEQLLDDDERTLYSYQIQNGTVIVLLLHCYHEYKQKQQTLRNAVHEEADIIISDLQKRVQHLDAQLWDSQAKIQSVSTISCLKSMISILMPQMVQCNGADAFYYETFRERVQAAKNGITTTHQQQIKEYTEAKAGCMNEILKCEREIQACASQVKVQNTKQIKQNIQSFCEDHYENYLNLYQSVADTNISAIDEDLTKVERIYLNCVCNTHCDLFKDVVDQKRMGLERHYQTWNACDVVAWIQLIEYEYFDGERWKDFMDKLKETQITGAQLPQINHQLFLKSMGLKEEEDQNVLIKHIERIVKHEAIASYPNICVLCTTNVVDTVVLPCKHCYSCYECNKKQAIEKCAICRKDITQIMQIFMTGFSR
eukprot:116100_1